MKRLIPQEEVKAILVINLGGIGDILLATPALRALRGLYPKAFIALLTIPRSVAIAEDLPYIDKIFNIQLSLKEDLRLFVSLRKMGFDMLINMRTLASWPGALKMATLFSLVGARYRVGRDTERRGFF